MSAATAASMSPVLEPIFVIETLLRPPTVRVAGTCRSYHTIEHRASRRQIMDRQHTAESPGYYLNLAVVGDMGPRVHQYSWRKRRRWLQASRVARQHVPSKLRRIGAFAMFSIC